MNFFDFGPSPPWENAIIAVILPILGNHIFLFVQKNDFQNGKIGQNSQNDCNWSIFPRGRGAKIEKIHFFLNDPKSLKKGFLGLFGPSNCFLG